MSSEVEIKSNILSTVVGTMDRKSPSSIYIVMNGYITPKNDKENYSDDLKTLENSLNNVFNTTIKTNDYAFDKNMISIFDVAGKRMTYEKKSYFSIQIFLKLKDKFLVDNENSFHKIAKTNELEQFMDENGINDLFEKCGFAISKTKC